jgi:hypothetical protein
MRLLGNAKTAIDSFGIVAQENADRIFLNGYLPAQLGQIRLCRVQQFLGLSRVRKRTSAVVLKRLCQLQRVLPGLDRAPGDLQLRVKAAQRKIRFSNIANTTANAIGVKRNFAGPVRQMTR